MNGTAAPKPAFTGRMFLGIMVAFFGVVVAVNITMARLASGTFGGTVVDNSYVASQKYNGWLAQARAQDQLGWATPVGLNSARRVVITVPGVSFAAKGTAHHPLGRAADVVLTFVTDGQGRLVSTAPLPAGRWQVRIDVSSGRDVKRLMEVLA
ncbi:FixH family protein [Sandarakinorhabdus limnophila]|uniref:FixH family protein n=1 Tax=Sandarakinorhabdus limnophila TaxID=210512 RepID=UPI0026EC09DA|nr:FixH family protein [Sandarakinorhabdus limnophila]MCM0033044.1 FixH family protein [Sandarakinorhabdus limnophila]